MGPIYILWLRSLRRFFRARARVLASLGQPILLLLALGFGFGPVFQRSGGGDYIQFLGPGIIMMGILFTAVVSGVEIIWDRQFGFLKETLVAPVPRLHIVLGRTLGGATISLIQGLVISGACALIGFRISGVSGLPLSFAFLGLIALTATAAGTAIGSVLEDMQAFPLIMNFFVTPLFFFSGAIFPVEGLPLPLRVLSEANPLTYGVDGLRCALSNGAQAAVFGLGTDLAVMSAASAALLAVGAWLFSRIQL